MSNIITIADLKKQVQDKVTLEDWKRFAEEQFSLLTKFERELSLLKEKNTQLETMLKQSVITTVENEEQICVEQIYRLKQISNDRQLTLEEVKKLDLLVKNLRLSREESTILLNNKKENVSEEELVAIAQSQQHSE